MEAAHGVANDKIELVREETVKATYRPMLWEMPPYERAKRLKELRKELTDA